MAAKTFKVWKYTTDDNKTYRKRLATYIATQVNGSSAVKVGGEQADTNDYKWPRGFTPRKAKVFDAVSGTSREVVCFDNTCDLFAVAGTTIQLNVGQPPVLTTFTRYGIVGERGDDDQELTTP